jgi:hypothetical protein
MKSLKPILYAGALVGVLDITAACINARVTYGFPPARVLKGVAGGLLGRGALEGGFATAALGLVMHFTMALTVVTIFYALSRLFPLPRKLSAVVAVGLLYGAAVFAVNNFAIPIVGSQPLSAYAVLIQAPNGLVAAGYSPVLRGSAHCAGDASIYASGGEPRWLNS